MTFKELVENELANEIRTLDNILKDYLNEINAPKILSPGKQRYYNMAIDCIKNYLKSDNVKLFDLYEFLFRQIRPESIEDIFKILEYHKTYVKNFGDIRYVSDRELRRNYLKNHPVLKNKRINVLHIHGIVRYSKKLNKILAESKDNVLSKKKKELLKNIKIVLKDYLYLTKGSHFPIIYGAYISAKGISELISSSTKDTGKKIVILCNPDYCAPYHYSNISKIYGKFKKILFKDEKIKKYAAVKDYILRTTSVAMLFDELVNGTNCVMLENRGFGNTTTLRKRMKKINEVVPLQRSYYVHERYKLTEIDKAKEVIMSRIKKAKNMYNLLDLILNE